MKVLTFILLACLATAANAQVYKCVDKQGKTNYQGKPCQVSAKEEHLEIKSDPAKESEAKAKMQMLQSEYDTQKARESQEEKQNIENSMMYQQQLQNQINTNPGVMMQAPTAPNQTRTQ